MIIYRGHIIGQEYDRNEILRTFIEAPNGDAWYTDRDPRDEIDSLLDETETLSETVEREAEWRRR